MELVIKEDGIYYANNAEEKITDLPPYKIRKLYFQTKSFDHLHLVKNFKIKWVGCSIGHLLHLSNIAKVKSCQVTIRSDEDLAAINNLVGIKIVAYFEYNYILNENLMTNPKIRYMDNINVYANLLTIAKNCEFLSITNYSGTNLSEVEEYLCSPECKVKYLDISGNINFDLVLQNQTCLSCFRYWPKNTKILQDVINITHNIPKIKFLRPIGGNNDSVDITPLLRDTTVESIKMGSKFKYDIDVLKNNETLLYFGPISNLEHILVVFKQYCKYNYRFIKEQTKQNRKFLLNRRFVHTKVAVL